MRTSGSFKRRWGVVLLLATSVASAWATGGEDETIAFSSSRSGNTDIYLVSADGGDLRRVTTASVEELEPCWSPDASRLAYQSRRPVWTLYSSLPDGSDERTLTSSLSWSPSWSPDGSSVAYSTGSSIRRVSVLTGEVDVLVASCGDCGRPAWSPDGAKMAFHSNASGNHDVYVLDLKDGTRHQLTSEPSRDFLAAWSPDGTRLVFTSERDGNLEIYTMRSDGSDVMRITNHPAADLLPAWSPSGDWIAFVTDRDGNREIYVMKPDGSSLRRLTDHPGDDMYPAWRP
jgi:TolB protein